MLLSSLKETSWIQRQIDFSPAVENHDNNIMNVVFFPEQMYGMVMIYWIQIQQLLLD